MTRQVSGGASIAAYRFNGKTYPFKTVSRCLTCQSPHRLEIEQMIARGVPYSRIVKDLDLREGRNRVTTTSMSSHFNNGHMPVQSEVVRRVIERRARERGADMDPALSALVEGQGFAELVLHRVVERLADGEIDPGIGDGLSAAKLLADLAPHEQAASEADYVAAFMEYHRVAQDLMTPSQFEEFGRRLASSAVLKALTEKYAEATTGSEDGDDFYSVGGPAAIESHVVDEDTPLSD